MRRNEENFYELSFPTNLGIGLENMFDQFRLIKENTCHHGNYPPYNIINESETESIIEMAVAGFSESDLDVEVEDNKLTVSGSKDVKLDDAKYRHKGIAYRNFTRSFALADHIQINGASIDCGILRIYLERVVPEEMKPKKINIVSDKEFLTTTEEE